MLGVMQVACSWSLCILHLPSVECQTVLKYACQARENCSFVDNYFCIDGHLIEFIL